MYFRITVIILLKIYIVFNQYLISDESVQKQTNRVYALTRHFGELRKLALCQFENHFRSPNHGITNTTEPRPTV